MDLSKRTSFEAKPGGTRSGAAAGTVGYFHETALYASDDELLEIVVPFLQGGLDAGEPTVVAFADHNAALVRSVFGDHDGLSFLPGADQYARPAVAIRSYQEMLSRLVHDGAHQIRIVGDVPHTGTGASWHEWLRYEAAVNEAYDAFPLWGLCPYDTRTAPAEVIDDVLATHPHVASAHGHTHNTAFGDPRAIATRRAPRATAARAADTLLVSPSSAVARRAADAAAADAGLDTTTTQHLLIVVSELVSNAQLHGAAPTTLELWTQPGAVEVLVTDAGPGPQDPFVGLTNPGEVPSGRGLWIAHQLATAITLEGDADGFAVRAILRNPA